MRRYKETGIVTRTLSRHPKHPLKAFLQQQYYSLKASRNHLLRKAVGVLLVLAGLVGFLPVVGYWMIPVGLALLAVDWAWARRLSRRLRVWYGRRIQGHRKKVKSG